MKKRIFPFFSSRGFSLLEVMVAMAILAMSVLALLNSQGTSLLATGRAEQVAIATHLARQKMEASILEIESAILKGEFPDEKEEVGTFEKEKYPEFVWTLKIRKVEIPVPPMPEESAQMMQQIFKMVTDRLAQSTREVQLIVSLAEDQEAQEMITLTTHVVNM